MPDLVNCDALARLYDVELNDLVRYDQEKTGMRLPPKGKHIFGAVRVGERGQIVLPKQARDVFQLRPGDLLVVLGELRAIRKLDDHKAELWAKLRKLDRAKKEDD